MRKQLGVLVLGLGIAGAALASKPKPMECDAWSCGKRCAPARYAAVRDPWMPPWLLASPVYGAIVLESTALGSLIFVGAIARKRRRQLNLVRSGDPVTGQL